MALLPWLMPSFDRRLQNAYKKTRRGEALRTRGAPRNSRGSRVWAMGERTRTPTRCRRAG